MNKFNNITHTCLKLLSRIIVITIPFVFIGTFASDRLKLVSFLELFFFAFLFFYYMPIREAEASENKKPKIIVSFFKVAACGLGLIIMLLIILVAKDVVDDFNDYNTASEYQYSLNDIYYSNETYDVVYNVEVDYISTELNKEDVYTLNLDSKNYSDYFDIALNWTESKYKALIGEGNNTFTSPGYLLTLSVPAIQNENNDVYSILIYRSACIGDSAFSDDEIERYATLALSAFTEMNNSEFKSFVNTSEIDDYGHFLHVDCSNDYDIGVLNEMENFQ